MNVSVVVPVHNEVSALENCLNKLVPSIEKITKNYEILIAEDGSTDGTYELAKKIASKYEKISLLHSDKKLGRGAALTRAFKLAKGKIVLYMDVDLATHLSALPKLIEKIENGYDFAIGSRLSKNSNCKRSILREIASRGYNALGRILFPTNLSDLQCGFKAFNRTKLLEIIDDVESKHWFWDTELLIRAKRKEYKIAQVPVKWQEGRGSKVVLARDIRNMGLKMVSLWWKINSPF